MNTNYELYLKEQAQRAESKWGRKRGYDDLFKERLNQTWLQVEDVLGQPRAICCMGVREGTEVFEFKQYYPKAEVYGVDITENVNTVKSHLVAHILKRDFNHLPLDWQDKFDLVFSNSLDHAFKPKQTIMEWHRVCRAGGHLLLELSTTPATNIEHSFKIEQVNDLFPIDHFEMIKLWETPDRNIFTGLFQVLK